MRLSNKVAIVTGASRGIGKAIALKLAEEGATVVVAARTEAAGGPLAGTIHQTAEEITKLGGKALPLKVDITKEDDIAQMVRQALEKLGRIDILVNNAGAGRPATLLEMQVRHWDMVINTNLRGPFLCTKAVLPTMAAQKSGSIINVSSLAAQVDNVPKTGLAYDVSKAGMNRFTWGLAEEVRQYSIAVNAMMPANTETEGWSFLNPKFDHSVWQRPQLWGAFAAFLASRDASTLTGRCLTADELTVECLRAGWTL